MVPKRATLSTDADDTIDPVLADRIMNLDLDPTPPSHPSPPVCRICLDDCPNTPYCLCKGSSMLHQRCLKQYLVKGQGNFLSRSNCQICKHPFRIIANKKCLFSCSNGLRQLKDHLTASILYAIFCILTVIYVGYCTHLNSLGSLSSNLQLILLIVGICLCIVAVVIGVKWVVSNLWIKVVILKRILPVERILRSLSMCPMREEEVGNETLEQM